MNYEVSEAERDPRPYCFGFIGPGLRGITAPFLDQACSKLHIEYLREWWPSPITTHAVIKVDYLSPVGNVEAVRITANKAWKIFSPRWEGWDGPHHGYGHLHVRALGYPGPTVSAIRSFSFDMVGSPKLGDILDLILRWRMHTFAHSLDECGRFCGNRDFVTQVFEKLNNFEFIEEQVQGVFPPEPPVPANMTGFDVTGLAFDHSGAHIERPIGYGQFLYFSRRDMPHMWYE
ncbi:hypothetical protein F5Y11DRAFT_340341 [Daldinia sp. FL1419]|nr:hypothetical protein F5Y11DRAFT_340341 [Daldinia sp. FL1419]